MDEIATGPKIQLSPDLAERVRQGVAHCFKVTFGVEITPEPFKVEKYYRPQGDIVGRVEMPFSFPEGQMSVSFELQTIAPILAKVYGEQYSSINAEVSEGVGEIINMIYCLMKNEMNSQGYNLGMALPQVFSGKDAAPAQAIAQVLVMPFKTDFGPFVVDIVLAA